MKRWTIACFGIAIILMFLSMFFMGVACVIDPAANICSGASGAPQITNTNQGNTMNLAVINNGFVSDNHLVYRTDYANRGMM